jgi:hypothetical protein
LGDCFALGFFLFEAIAFFVSAKGVDSLAGFDLLDLVVVFATAFDWDFALAAVDFLLGLAVNNFTAAFGLAVFLRSVGKVKLLVNLASKATQSREIPTIICCSQYACLC